MICKRREAIHIVMVNKYRGIQSIVLRKQPLALSGGHLSNTSIQLSCWVCGLALGKVRGKTLPPWHRGSPPVSRNSGVGVMARPTHGFRAPLARRSKTQKLASTGMKHKAKWLPNMGRHSTYEKKSVKMHVFGRSSHLYTMSPIPFLQTV